MLLLFGKNFSLQNLEKLFLYTIIIFLPTQLGKHFWPSFSFVEGIRIDYLSPTVYLTDLLIVLLSITYILRLHIQHKVVISNFKFQISNTQLKYWILVVLVLIGSILSSLSPIAGFYKLVKILEFGFLGWFLATKINLKRDIASIAILLSIGIIFESVLAIAQFIKQSSIGGVFWFFGERTFSGQTPGIANASLNGQLTLRPYGTFPHPNVLAGYLTIAMAIVISNIKFQISNFKKALLASAAVFGSLALLLTLSRVTIVLWFIIFISWFITSFNRKSLIINPSSLIIRLLLVLVLIGGIFLTPLPSRFTSILDVDKETVTRRQELNIAAIEMVKKSPVFGVGLNNFLINLAQLQESTRGPLWLQPAHNAFLLIAAETGIVGLLFFLWFIIKTFIRIKKSIIYHLSFIIFFELIFLGMFDHYFLTVQQGQLLLAFVLGISWAKN